MQPVAWSVRDLVVVSVPEVVGAQPGGLEVELDTLAVAVHPGPREQVRVLVTNHYRPHPLRSRLRAPRRPLHPRRHPPPSLTETPG